MAGYFTNDELEHILYNIVRTNGFTEHIHGPMSQLPEAIEQITTQQFEVASGNFVPKQVSNKSGQREIESMNFSLRFTKTYIEPHMVSNGDTGKVQLDPTTCRRQHWTYCADFYVEAVFEATATMYDKTTKTIKYPIGKTFVSSIPIEVGNRNCVYTDMTREQIYLSQGDADFYRGLFIVEGQIYVVHTVEMNKYNQAKVECNMHGKEIARSTYLSRAAIYRNSYQMIIRRMDSGLIMIEMTVDVYNERPIPFSLFFYMLGVTSDREIEDMIAMSADDAAQITHEIRQIIQTAVSLSRADATFSAPMNSASATDIMRWLVNYTANDAYTKAATQNERQSLIAGVQKLLDTMFMVNQTYAKNDANVTVDQLRRKKAIMLATLIHDTVLTSIQRSAGTDRDHIKEKRYHTVGQQFTRIFKKHFNLCVIKPIREALSEAFENIDFEKVNVVDIVKTRLANSDLLKTFEREIKSSTDTFTVKNTQTKRVLNAESLSPPKSMVHLLSVKRTVVRKGIVSKEAKRAQELRGVHSSKASFICNVTSADTGENVGMADQLTPQTTVTNFLEIHVCQHHVWAYPELISWDQIMSRDMKRSTLVYINGDWYGGVNDAHRFLSYLRRLRRRHEIDLTISIVYNTKNNRIDVWTDEGRLITPFLVVYDNSDELRAFDIESRDMMLAAGGSMGEAEIRARVARRPQYHQEILLTRDMLERIASGSMTFNDLIDQGVMEYVSSEEIQNCIIAPTHKDLWESRHNEMTPFSHCMIPLGMFGIPAWTGTLPTMSDATRHCFQTNMGKSTNGFLSPIQAYMGTRNMSVQMSTFHPVNPTPADQVMNHGGQHLNVAFRCDGDNQEDSLNFNEGFIQRGGFASTTFNKKVAECRGAQERFGSASPDNIRQQEANRTKLNSKGYVEPGTIITAGDVLVAKYSRREINGAAVFVDTSITYDHHEDAYVTNIEQSTMDNVSRITVHYRILRNPSIGSKFASRSGNKGVISRIIPEAQMPYGLFTGRTADIYINCHSFPSRMLPGEVMADLIGEVAARLGVIIPVSPFMNLDPQKITDMMWAQGVNRFGLEPMRDARIGTITRALCVTTSFRQCLQKFAESEASARHVGRLSPVTRNSLAGAQNNGGMRTGEMEFWVTAGQGASVAMDEFQAAKPAAFDLHVCSRCGQRAIVNDQKNIYICQLCKQNAQIVVVQSKFMSNSLMSYMEGMGVKIKIETKPATCYVIET